MDHKQRYKRLRLLIARLNKERKKQAKKTDILCNDLISAQRGFIKRLGIISFAADFYEAIVGITDLNSLLYTTCGFIKDQIPYATIAFFLRRAESFELHLSETEQPISFEKQRLENCFTPELVSNISKSNKPCTLDDMFAMGLQGNLISLNKFSAVTVPLGQLGSSLGFILIYCSSDNKLAAENINKIAVTSPWLSRAIQSCQAVCHSAD